MSALREAPDSRAALTIGEAAAAMGVSKNTFRRHVLPTIRAVRCGRAVVIAPAELDAWLERRGTLNTEYS